MVYERDPELRAAVGQGAAVHNAEAGGNRHRAEDLGRSPIEAQAFEFSTNEAQFEASVVGGQVGTSEVAQQIIGDVAEPRCPNDVARREAVNPDWTRIALGIDHGRPRIEFASLWRHPDEPDLNDPIDARVEPRRLQVHDDPFVGVGWLRR